MLTFRFYHTYKYDLLLISICYISSQNVVIYTVLFMLESYCRFDLMINIIIT